MSLKIRLQRGGSNHKPHYRMVVAESTKPRDGRFVEVLGTYDPRHSGGASQIALKLDRVDYWVGVGAQPSDTCRALIKKARKATPAPAATA